MATKKNQYRAEPTDTIDFDAAMARADSMLASSQQAGQAKQGAGFFRTMGDMAIKGAQGVVDLGASAVGLGNIATGGMVGKGMGAMGYDPKRTNLAMGEYLSQAQKDSDAKVQNAEGFLETVGQAATEPRFLAGAVVQSLPGLLAMGGVQGAVARSIAGKAALSTAEGTAAATGLQGAEALTAALSTQAGGSAAKAAVQAAEGKLIALGSASEGAQTAGGIAQEAQQAGRTWDQYAPSALGAGAMTAAIGFGAGKIMGDAGTKIFTGADTKLSGSLPMNMLKSGFSEGALEEMPQSASEQIFKNLAMGEADLMKGAPNAAGSGLVTGAAMGLGFGAMGGSGAKTPQQTAADAKPLLQLGNTPDPLIGFPDGTVARRTEMDAYINALPEDQRVAARAKMMGLGPQPMPPSFAGILDTDSVYSSWSNVQDGSDRATMRDQMDYVAKTYGPNITQENKEAIKLDLKQQFKWFRAAPPAQQDAALSAMIGPATPADQLRATKVPVSGPMSAAANAGIEARAQSIEANPDADKAELDSLVETERRDQQVMLAQMDQDRQKQTEIEAAFAAKPELDATTTAVEQAATIDAPNAMQAAFNKLADKTIGPEPEAPPVATKEPRIVPRTPDMKPIPLELAELQVDMVGGEVARVQNANGKFGYVVVPKPTKPAKLTAATTKTDTGTQEGDTFNNKGKPFTNFFSAEAQASRMGAGYEPVKLRENAFVVRAKPVEQNTPTESVGGNITTQAEPEKQSNQTLAVESIAPVATESVSTLQTAQVAQAPEAPAAPEKSPEEVARKQQIDRDYSHLPEGNRPTATRYGEGKQPWEIHSAEFGRQKNGNPHWNQSYAGQDDGAYLADTQKTHKKIVTQAIADGQTVPQSVLSDYPDLQPNNTPAASTQSAPIGVATQTALAPTLALKLQEAHKANGRDVTQEIVQRALNREKNDQAGTPKAKGERAQRIARLESDLALFTQPAQPVMGEGSGVSQPTQVAPGPADDRVGRDNTPISEGGKPFKTKRAAMIAKKLQPAMRVVSTEGGYVLKPKTEKQLAAEEKAAKRLSLPRAGQAGVPTAAHEFIATEGGMDPSTRNEFSMGDNPRVGNRRLFAGSRGGMTLERATEKLIEAGYLPQGASHSDAVSLIGRSFTNPQYTATGTETVAQAEIEARFDDYLAEQEDAAQNNDFDPFESMAGDGFIPSDIDMTGYDELQDPIKLEVNALLAQANALGIDTSEITEQAHEETRNGSEQDYYEAARTALASAVETSNRDSSEDSGQQGNAGEPEGLTAPTRADIEAQQERADQAAKSKEAADRATERAAADNEDRKRIAKASEAAADTFVLGGDALDNLTGQGNMFDAPAEAVPPATAPVSKTETTAPAEAAPQDAPEPALPAAEAAQPKPAKIEDVGDGAFSRSTADKPIRNLVTLHNLSSENLLYSNSVGGIPVPSIGITKVDSAFGGFGDITLIAPKGMIDPASGTPVYDRDAYTARHPEMNFKKVSAKRADAFYDRVNKVRELGFDGGFVSQVWEAIKNNSVQNPDKVWKIFQNYDAARLLYASDVLDKTIKVPMRSLPVDFAWTVDKAFAKTLADLQNTLMDYASSEVQASPEMMQLSNAARAAIGRLVDKSSPQADLALRDDLIENMATSWGNSGAWATKPDEPMSWKILDKVLTSAKNSGKTEVDRGELSKRLDKLVSRDSEAYADWAMGLIKPLFDAPTITLRGREVAPTLENVVEAMTIGATAGAEKTMVSGVGKTAAMLGKRFKSMAEIQAARDQVVPESVETEGKKATDKLLEDYRNRALTFYTEKDWNGKIDTWAGMDAAMDALAAAGKMGKGDAAIRMALARKGFFKVDQTTVDMARAAIDAIRSTATNYFEAKPQRAVKLNEFKGAVVPKGTSQEVLDVLAANGIEVVTYNKKDPEAKNKALEKLARKIDKVRGDVLFSRSATPTRGLPTTQVTSIVDAIRARWGNAPEIIVVSDMNDPLIPQKVRDQDQMQKSQGATGEPEGFIYKSKVYLLASELATPTDVMRVLFHEALGHAGLRGVFGDKLKPILQQIAALRRTEVAAKATQYGLDMNTEAGRLEAAEEVLAEMAQKNPELGYVQRAIGLIRGWLRANVPGFSSMKLTDADIVAQFILPARRHIEGKGGVGDGNITTQPMFSRSLGATLTNAAPGRHSWDAPEVSQFDDLVYKLQDKQIDTKRVVDAIKAAAGGLADEKNVYLQEELFHGRAAARTEDFVNKELGPLVNLMKVRGIDIPMLDEYLHARHAEEANKLIAERNQLPDAGQLDLNGKAIESPLQDGGSGMTTQAARDYLAKLTPAERTRLDAVAAKVDAILTNTRQLYADYDLESQGKVDGWGTMFKHYVPLMREDKDGGMGIGQGFSIKGKEVKGRTGSTRKVVDILANIAMQRERAIVRGEKNRVATALVGLVKLNPNKAFWHVGPPPASKVYDPASNSVVERTDPMYKSRDNVVVAKIKGKDGSVTEQAVTFSEDDPRAVRMAAALKNLDANQLEGLLGVSAKITRYFAAINTQYNPIFGTVNLVRDVQGALFNLSSTPLKGKALAIAGHTFSALKGIYLDARATRDGKSPTSKWAALWDDFQAEGGQTGFRDLFTNSADRAKAIERELNPTAWMDGTLGKVFTANGALKVPLAVAQKKATGMFDWLSDYNLAMENAVRLAAYKVALEQGISKQQSASLGKNLTVNFNRKGQVGQQAGALYAFFNASMQGTARLGQTLFDMEPGKPKTLRMSATGKKIIYGGLLLGAMQALLLAAAGFDDEEPPDFVRERSLIIPTGGKTYITIPMPLGLHVLPNMGRIPMEFAMGGFKDPVQHVAKIMGLLAGSFNPIGGGASLVQMLAPTAIDPLVAIAENKDWTGKPIAKTAYNKATPGHLLAKDTASAPAKMLAEAINIMSGGTEFTAGVLSPTPDQIDYLFGQVTGGVGREASKLQQSGSAMVSGEDLPIHKVPLVGRFYGDADTQSAQSGKFYSAINKLNVHEAEIKGLRKDGRGAEAAQYIQENPEARLFVAANLAEREVQKLRSLKRELIAKDAPADEVKAMETRVNERMTRFNLTMQRLREKEAA